MATATRSRKRAAEKRTDEDEKKRTKRNQLCNSTNTDFLGFCNLPEIDYYEALKLNFEQDSQQYDSDFALLVARKANVVTNQVRKYPNLTDLHHHNMVQNVLILIEHARSVLMDENKKKRYDVVVARKHQDILKIFDCLVDRLFQIENGLSSNLKEFVDELAVLRPNFDQVLIITNALENWLAEQPITKLRPTSMNRILIKSTVKDDHFTKESIRENFKLYGEIVNVYVCDVDTKTAIVEYRTQDAQIKAIKQNENSAHFIVTEYMLKKFFDSQLRNKLDSEMVKIKGWLNTIGNELANIQSRHVKSE